jgi:hypothetical protein
MEQRPQEVRDVKNMEHLQGKIQAVSIASLKEAMWTKTGKATGKEIPKSFGTYITSMCASNTEHGTSEFNVWPAGSQS